MTLKTKIRTVKFVNGNLGTLSSHNHDSATPQPDRAPQEEEEGRTAEGGVDRRDSEGDRTGRQDRATADRTGEEERTARERVWSLRVGSGLRLCFSSLGHLFQVQHMVNYSTPSNWPRNQNVNWPRRKVPLYMFV